MITDEQSLKSASHGGYSLKTYDDGYGPLFVYGHEFGPVAVIRAQTWEDAYSIAEDEFMPGASWADVLSDYPDAPDDEDYLEAYGHRPNGSNGPDDEGIFSRSDYEWLQPLTPAMEISVEIADPEPEPVQYCAGAAAVRWRNPSGRIVQSYQGAARNRHAARVLPARATVRHATLGRWWDNPEVDDNNPHGPEIQLNPSDWRAVTANNPWN